MSFPSAYAAFIQWIGDGTGAPDSLLHVHAGMAILILARVATGRSLSTPIPLAIVALAELTNEILDRINHGSWLWPDTISDVINTLFWPTVIMIGLRLRKPRRE